MVGRDMTKKTSAVQGCGISKYVRSAEAKVFRIGESQVRDDVKKKTGKISDIVQNSNYPLPPWPNNDK